MALSRGSPRLAVSQHPALWSPDLPRPARRAAAIRLTHHLWFRMEGSNPHLKGQNLVCVHYTNPDRGAQEGVRTLDLRFTRAALFQLSYPGNSVRAEGENRTPDNLFTREVLFLLSYFGREETVGFEPTDA